MKKRKKTRKKKKEKGCTEPLFGKKAKCIIKIVPKDKKVKTFQMDFSAVYLHLSPLIQMLLLMIKLFNSFLKTSIMLKRFVRKAQKFLPSQLRKLLKFLRNSNQMSMTFLA